MIGLIGRDDTGKMGSEGKCEGVLLLLAHQSEGILR
jgi:hypothetical protein